MDMLDELLGMQKRLQSSVDHAKEEKGSAGSEEEEEFWDGMGEAYKEAGVEVSRLITKLKESQEYGRE